MLLTYSFPNYRADVTLMGVVIRPKEEEENSTKLTWISQISLKGWVPKMVVNRVTMGYPVSLCDDLTQVRKTLQSVPIRLKPDCMYTTPLDIIGEPRWRWLCGKAFCPVSPNMLQTIVICRICYEKWIRSVSNSLS